MRYRRNTDSLRALLVEVASMPPREHIEGKLSQPEVCTAVRLSYIRCEFVFACWQRGGHTITSQLVRYIV
jgi:hypothetical protein